MNLEQIKGFELEITSACNAACPGCVRTLFPDLLTINRFTIADLQRLFPERRYIEGKRFKFCGVLGDPIANPDFFSMIKYLATRGGRCQVSTNGGMMPAQWWEDLGKISRETNNIDIHFCVDGHRETNHIYRVNTNFDVIERNMSAYASESTAASWIYIVFDHNEHELEIAQDHARRLGFGFATRTGMRNSYHDWLATIKQRDKETRKINHETKMITTTGDKEHKDKLKIAQIDQYLDALKKNRASDSETKEMVDSIVCRYVHEHQLFIASDLTLWPCCYLWTESHYGREFINERLNIASGWNKLNDKNIDQVLSNPWFQTALELSWDPKHNLHLQRCIKTCALSKAYHNKFNFKFNYK